MVGFSDLLPSFVTCSFVEEQELFIYSGENFGPLVSLGVYQRLTF